MRATPKGDIRHLVPAADAIARMEEPARPALILFPRYGFAPAERPVAPSEVYVRLTQASTNYTPLGEPGLDRKSGVEGKSVSVRVDSGGSRSIKQTKQPHCLQ